MAVVADGEKDRAKRCMASAGGGSSKEMESQNLRTFMKGWWSRNKPHLVRTPDWASRTHLQTKSRMMNMIPPPIISILIFYIRQRHMHCLPHFSAKRLAYSNMLEACFFGRLDFTLELCHSASKIF